MLSFSSFARDSSDLIAMSVLAKRAALARTIICNSHATQPEMSSSAATRRPNAAVRNPTPRHQHGARSMHFGAFARASHPHLWRGTAARALCPRGVGVSGRQCTHLCRGEPQRGDEAHQSHGWVCAAWPHTPHASSAADVGAGGRAGHSANGTCDEVGGSFSSNAREQISKRGVGGRGRARDTARLGGATRQSMRAG